LVKSNTPLTPPITKNKMTNEKKYCEDCVLECYKAGLDVRKESIVKNKDECSFKDKHINFKEVKK
jgi:ribulose 1,5-bisphosphate carboxylase large subunit-like protein|tara:strand:- start:115 stop:309 length:195 start_codon:yes stop_codon:yes gene_type:complete